jgi:8-oxo-dGTP diphosphatase
MRDFADLLVVVAVALIDRDSRVLVQQRPPGKSMAGLWEFPGGKVEAGEAPGDALVREVREELGVIIDATHLEPLRFVSEPLGDRQLLLLLYVCRQWSGDPAPYHATALQWLPPSELYTLAMPPADRPLIAALAQLR